MSNINTKSSWLDQLLGLLVILPVLPFVIATTGCPEPIRPLCERGVACHDTDSGEPVEATDTEDKPTTGDPTEGGRPNLCLLALNTPEVLETDFSLSDPECAVEAAKYDLPMIKGCDNLCYPLKHLGNNKCDNPKKTFGDTTYLDCAHNPDGEPLAFDCWDCNQDHNDPLCDMSSNELKDPALGEAECQEMTDKYKQAAVVGCDGECHFLSWVNDDTCHDPSTQPTDIDLFSCDKFGGYLGKGDCDDCSRR